MFLRIEGTNALAPWTNYTVLATNRASPGGVASETAVLEYLADADKDGLADAWEQQFLGGTGGDPLADSDQDTLNNGAEALAGTDPTDALSRFEVRAQVSPLGALIRFVGVSNRTYTVQFSGGLLNSPWRALAHLTASPTNRLMEVLDPPVSSNRLYRIVTPFQP